jgi:hypothetical protein
MLAERELGPALEAPDLFAPVVAFRRWRLIDGELCSPYAPFVWREAIACAGCLTAGDHAVPDPACGCGIGAYREPQADIVQVDFRAVTGVVSLWGRLEVGADLIRAEFARVEALAVCDAWSSRQHDAVRSAARDLGADLIPLHAQAEAALGYGEPLAETLFPAAA